MTSPGDCEGTSSTLPRRPAEVYLSLFLPLLWTNGTYGTNRTYESHVCRLAACTADSLAGRTVITEEPPIESSLFGQCENGSRIFSVNDSATSLDDS